MRETIFNNYIHPTFVRILHKLKSVNLIFLMCFGVRKVENLECLIMVAHFMTVSIAIASNNFYTFFIYQSEKNHGRWLCDHVKLL